MMAILDTQALIWWTKIPEKLGRRAAVILKDPDVVIGVPVMVLCETRYLVHRKRVALDFAKLLREIRRSESCRILPLTDAAIDLMPDILDIHDAIIVGTALAYGQEHRTDVVALTSDRMITESGSIEVVWN